MLFYIFIFISLFVVSFLEIFYKSRYFYKFTYLCVILLFFILSFIRWDTGTDWDSYYEMYTWVKEPWSNFFTGMEPGFIFVNHLAKMLFDSYTGVLFLFSLILYMSIFRSFAFYSVYPIFSIFIYYSIAFASVFFVRQNVASALLLVSLIFVTKSQPLKFFIFVLLSSLFHRTAWCFLLVYPIYHIKIENIKVIITSFVSIILGLFLSKYLFSFIGDLGLGIISNKIETYLMLGADDNTMAISTSTILFKGFVNRLFLLIVFICLLKNNRSEDKIVNGLFNIYVLGTILYCVTLPLSISLARIALYMDIVQVFLIPFVVQIQKSLISKLLIFLIFSVYLFFRFYTMFISYESAYSPFKTIFDV